MKLVVAVFIIGFLGFSQNLKADCNTGLLERSPINIEFVKGIAVSAGATGQSVFSPYQEGVVQHGHSLQAEVWSENGIWAFAFYGNQPVSKIDSTTNSFCTIQYVTSKSQNFAFFSSEGVLSAFHKKEFIKAARALDLQIAPGTKVTLKPYSWGAAQNPQKLFYVGLDNSEIGEKIPNLVEKYHPDNTILGIRCSGPDLHFSDIREAFGKSNIIITSDGQECH